MRAVSQGSLAAVLIGMTIGSLSGGSAALAQDYGVRPPPASTAPRAAPQQKAPAAPPAAAAAPRAPAEAPRSDAQLRQRVEELEKEIVDMHVLVGTLETLARQGGGSGPGTGGGYSAAPLTGQEASRISALETQVQALAAQVEQMMTQMRGGGGGVPVAPAETPRRPAAGGFQKSNVPPPGGGFGSTVVTPGGGDGASAIDGPGVGGRQASAGAGAKFAYEAAYAQLLQQDYDGAEQGFSEFLSRFPGDGLAANAQYWLGETYYLRGQWDAAAQAFYKVAQSYGNSVKAPDSLAKLAMALDRNGKRPAACAALGELNKRYPNAPAHVRGWEQAERKRTGCT